MVPNSAMTFIALGDKIWSPQIHHPTVVYRCSVKKVFLKISQNSQKNTCARVSFLIMLQHSDCNFIKKRLWHRFVPMNFVSFLRKIFCKTPPVAEVRHQSISTHHFHISVLKSSSFIKKLFLKLRADNISQMIFVSRF